MASHRINRVEIEVEVRAVEHGQAVIERLSLLHPRRIAPLIDRVCSELSGPDRHDRIDMLELELGPIALDEFDDDFIRKLEAALRAALARLLGRQASERPETAALELLEGFARTGNLPWWAERGRVGPSEAPITEAPITEPLITEPLITEHIRIVLDAAPERWFGLLHGVADDPAALTRLALYCDVARIEAIAERAGLARERVTELRELERWVVETRVFGSARVAESRVRGAWLAALGRGGTARSARMPEVIGELLGLAPSVLAPLRRAIAASTAKSSADPPPAGSPAWSPAWLPAAATKVLAGIERPREAEGAAANDLIGGGRPASGHVAPRMNAAIPTRPEPDVHEPESEPTPAEPESPERPTTRASEQAPSSPPEQSIDAVQPIAAASTPREPAARQPAARQPAARQPADPPARQTARRRALDRLETLYVDDAGLVILWPFLDRFFLRTGLLDLDRRFIDEQATMQAIALLAQLAFEDPEPPEFRLPLAKLLCGCPPEAAFTLERPLAPEQIAECDRLLTAVIDNAPILRDATVASFRTDFVQRSAALSIREGAWLLEVEERPHDLVLERFPWSWSCLKLAWMPDPLFVRW